VSTGDVKFRWFDGLVWQAGPPKDSYDLGLGASINTPCVVYAHKRYAVAVAGDPLPYPREAIKWHAYLEMPTNTEPPCANPTT